MLLVQGLSLKDVHDLLHGLRNWVLTGEGVTLEQRIKHRLGDDVLCQHLDGVVLADARVQVLADALEELVKGLLALGVGLFQQRANAHLVAVGDLGDALGPVLPVAAVAALVDDLGEHCVLPLAQLHRVKIKPELVGHVVGLVVASADADHVDHAVAFAGQVDGGELLVKPVIVGAQGVEHLPHHAVLLVVVQRGLGRRVLANADGEDHIAVLLAACRVFAHHATD